MFIARLKVPRLSSFACRYSSKIAISQISFSKFGNPTEVLERLELQVSRELKKNEVLLKMMAAPVHPADINTIQGVYGIKPALPAVPGIEGVAEVLQVGSSVRALQSGDKVIPIKRTFGTWRTHQVCSEEFLVKVIPQYCKFIICVLFLRIPNNSVVEYNLRFQMIYPC